MNILGINQVPGMYAWQHDSAATVIKNGKLISSVEEERFNRLRHSRNYPHQAIKYGLAKADLYLKDLDAVAVSFNPYAFLKRWPINLHPETLAQNLLNLIVFWRYKRSMKSQTKAKILFIDHHLSHAASSYRMSGFKDSNILTIDGSGETESFAVYVAKNGKIKKLWDIPLAGIFEGRKNKSIGLIYSRITNLIGLGVNGEGKTMGLASYGNPTYDFSKILNIQNHKKYTIDRKAISRLYSHLERSSNDEIKQEHEDLAASLQKALEDSIVNLAKEVSEHTGLKNFCLAGGVALNCNTNTKLLEQDFVENIFIQPAATDGGASLGAALEAAYLLGEPADFKMTHAYWGPSFKDEEIEKVLKDAKAKYRKSQNIEKETAGMIKKGKIVGWFQGALEIGPRALGNRSILADPTISGMNDRVNKFVKHREPWRPFAPSVLEEEAGNYFEIVKNKESSSPYMLHVFYVKEEYRDKLPAITHIDGSSRIQTVNKDQNERYYNLIREFKKESSYPIILNTSFNDKVEPIVASPKDALRCFFSTGLDALAIGNFILEK